MSDANPDVRRLIRSKRSLEKARTHLRSTIFSRRYLNTIDHMIEEIEREIASLQRKDAQSG